MIFPQNDLIVHVYAAMWNEHKILPFFLKHYGKFAEKIFLYDNMSDDGSAQIALAHPKVEVVQFDTCGKFREDVLIDIRSYEWKKSRGKAHWVIVCDVDEFIWHPYLIPHLKECTRKKITVCNVQGFQMVSDHFPSLTKGQVYDQIRTGYPFSDMNKKIVFNPNAIWDLLYSPGSHWIESIKGKVVWDTDRLVRLLHYKWLGAPYINWRYQNLNNRIYQPTLRDLGWNGHYAASEQIIKDLLREKLNMAQDVVWGDWK
jgi:hypothetical protein